ncbi:MAG: hypothetical protein Q4B81_03770 [Moraxella sp.]|nr:hypothetical protein [Moraxella sp.]
MNLLGIAIALPNLRASWEKIKNIKIVLPILSEQQNIITQIEQYEHQIQKAEQIMNASSDKKKAILAKYL